MKKYGDMEKTRIESFEIHLFADRRGSCAVVVTRSERDETGKALLYSEVVYENVSGFTIARLLNACPISLDHLKRMEAERTGLSVEDIPPC